MKKLLLSLATICAMVPAYAAKGDATEPYTVAEVIAMGTDLNVASAYVSGYIVGNANGQAITSAIFTQTDEAKFTASNILLADDAACTDVNACIPVQLVANTDIRKALNLMDNAGNLGKQLTIAGQLIKYFGVPGMKAPTDYTLEGAVTPDPVENTKVAGIADFLAGADKTVTYEFTTPVTVVYQSANNLWVQDAQGSMLVYGAVNQTYQSGDVIPAGFTGKYDYYLPTGATYGTPEFIAPAGFKPASGTAELRTEVFPVEEIEAGLVNSYVKVEGVDIVLEDNNTYAVQDGAKIQLFDKFNITVAEGTNMNVEGIIAIYKDVAQICPLKVTDASGVVVEKVATPKFAPGAGAVVEGTVVKITCATEGAAIYYTTDGTEPTSASTPYTEEGIAVEAAMTIKAIALCEGMQDSEVATAEYTIKEAGTYLGDFDSFNDGAANTAYGTYTNATGWTATNCAILGAGNNSMLETGSTTLSVCMNGKTSAVGSIASPKLEDGIGTLTFDYGLPFSDTKIDVKIEVKDGNGNVVASDQLTNTSATKLTVYNYSHLFSVEGDFFVTLTNLSPSSSTKNADRTAVWNLTWNKLSSGIANVEAKELNAPVEYFNIQGQRVAEPANGLYIRRQGSKVEKVVIR